MNSVFAADYPFLDIVWTMIIFFSWVIWIWMVVTVLADVFRRHDISGWAKAAWVVFILVLPFLGVLIYLIGNSKHMAAREEQPRAARAEFDDYVKTVAAPGGPAMEIDAAARQRRDHSSRVRRDQSESARVAGPLYLCGAARPPSESTKSPDQSEAT